MTKIDVLFTNANVLTLDKNNSRSRSVAVSNGKIFGIWNEPEPPSNVLHTTEQTKVIDLKGATLMPGFIDTHNHILMYGLLRDQVNCSTPPNESIANITEAIGQKTEETPAGEWIRGYGFDDTLIDEKRHITRDDLDAVSPNHPVMISHISGHLAAVNSLALQYAGLDDKAPDPVSGGHFGRDQKGSLNGVLYEPGAMEPVYNVLPQKTVEQMTADLKNVSNEYVAQGITTNSDAKVSSLDELEVHLRAAQTGANPMRARLMISNDLLRQEGPFGNYTAAQLDRMISEQSNGNARLDSAKMFQDGSIQGLTGALREPYYQHPDIDGDLIHEQESFQEEVLDLHRRGFRVTTHGNGDRAIGSILAAYEYALEKFPMRDHRHRIEHVQTGQPEDLKKMAKLQVAGSFFINHVYYWGDRHEQIFLGPERARRISPLAEAAQHNLLFTLHSDCPVTPISPLFSVWSAVNRTTRNGKLLGPEQRIDVVTALKAMTIYGAALNFEEEHTGSIEIGKQADFTILEADPTTVHPDEIKDITIQATFINGQSVYENKNLITS
ncbi:amidohydrolase [Virgibacillus alimentarius]|uniref:Amidohydrolase YtcJ n=1 Tax=Virgibacillus alimentarius TaxID=698769 RepID=A0ABS4S904_9BACI|nr:amidohydrolase [Virgibacillus alimentarius]MBP2257450.1 putative amidohydrolase YtcJ [Virgibacillus alimentarius]